jgi:hypothetical protein
MGYCYCLTKFVSYCDSITPTLLTCYLVACEDKAITYFISLLLFLGDLYTL